MTLLRCAAITVSLITAAGRVSAQSQLASDSIAYMHNALALRLAESQDSSSALRNAVPAPAPGLRQEAVVVKTVPLHHLTSQAAVKLLVPYVRSPGGGVFDVAAPTRAVTIRETPKIYAEMMSVLAQYDHEPATITLKFQLIAAENTNTRDPALAGLDSLLRGVLKYSGYRLLNTSVATASEYGHVAQELSADGDAMKLSVDVTELRSSPIIIVDGARTGGGESSVHLNVSLERDAVPMHGDVAGHGPTQLFSTGVTVPIGQTVVLGTSAVDGAQRALILTVRPQIATAKR